MNRVKKIIACSIYTTLMKQIDQLETNRLFCRHGFSHSMDVARIAHLLNMENGGHIDKPLIYAAGLLHDIGRAFPMAGDHSAAGIDVIEKILDLAGFTEDESRQITHAILQHRGHETENNHTLAAYIQKADKYARNCFLCAARESCYWPEDKKNKTIEY